MATDSAWSFKIAIRDPNPNNPLVDITGTRTVGTDVRAYSLPAVSLDKKKKSMAAIAQDIVDKLYDKFERDNERKAAKAALPATYAGLDALLAAAMNAKETN